MDGAMDIVVSLLIIVVGCNSMDCSLHVVDVGVGRGIFGKQFSSCIARCINVIQTIQATSFVASAWTKYSWVIGSPPHSQLSTINLG